MQLKKFKKILTVMLVLSLLSGTCSINASAASNNPKDVISLKEYSAEMKKLYAEYGVTYEVLKKNEDIVLTREILTTQLENARKSLEENKQNSQNTYVVNIDTSNDFNSLTNIFSPQSVMPYSYSHTSNVLVRSPSGMGFAYFDLTLDATADAQYSTFMRINNYTCSQSGGYLNFKSWEQTSKSYSLSSGNQLCNVSFNGRLTIEYTEPTSGLVVGNTSNHNITFTFAAYW